MSIIADQQEKDKRAYLEARRGITVFLWDPLDEKRFYIIKGYHNQKRILKEFHIRPWHFSRLT